MFFLAAFDWEKVYNGENSLSPWTVHNKLIMKFLDRDLTWKVSSQDNISLELFLVPGAKTIGVSNGAHHFE